MSGAARLVLFDLDGTLVDTARDLHAAANALCAAHGRPPVAFEGFRCRVSQGGRAMLDYAFDQPGADVLEALLPEFLARYGRALALESRLFDGLEPVLAALEAGGRGWGIVSNKPEQLARGVVEGLGLGRRCRVLIGGDTLPVRKPDPAPLLEACRRLDVRPEAACYVGDDRRDVEAARAAGMPAIVAGWGYIGAGERTADWGADRIVATPAELLALPEFAGV